jgi:hypothetical protein
LSQIVFLSRLGVVAGFLGSQAAGGEFLVQEVCFPTYAHPQAPLTTMDNDPNIPMVAFTSGFQLGNDAGYDMPTQLMMDYLTGDLPGVDLNFVQRISRLVIAGNSVQKLSNTNHQVDHYFR